MTRHLHQELKAHIPDCDACARDEHDMCVPIVQVTATVCACFAAHPNSDAHDNAIYWWTTQGQWKPAEHSQQPPMVNPDTINEMFAPGNPARDMLIDNINALQRSCSDHPHWSGMSNDCPFHIEKEDADPPGDPALRENGRTSENE